MTKTIIVIPFGVAGLKEINRSADPEAYILEKIKVEMRRQGFGSEQFYRAVFEDALDYAVQLTLTAVGNKLKESHKVAKVLKFEVSVPRRE